MTEVAKLQKSIFPIGPSFHLPEGYTWTAASDPLLAVITFTVELRRERRALSTRISERMLADAGDRQILIDDTIRTLLRHMTEGREAPVGWQPEPAPLPSPIPLPKELLLDLVSEPGRKDEMLKNVLAGDTTPTHLPGQAAGFVDSTSSRFAATMTTLSFLQFNTATSLELVRWR